ncbi:hypothetical protein [Lysobacter niastensis]|uniref:PLD phosphodiesterase domain-containing protein n=1 Tax=Lysobacter niastensis TaxID=380629 RepID=A0ABS0BBV4_9GAMM|nr:hypothetical protein [Lysobacter niastensis]MBF6025402.1 hypothetical protein [Lysobacter niastensis]
MGIPADQCVALLRDALSNRPTDPWSDEAAAWFAEVAGIINAHDGVLGMPFQMLIPRVTNRHSGGPTAANLTLNAQTEFVTRAKSALTQLQLVTNTFTTRQLGAGAVHDYFEEVRQLIAGATREVLFIDPYIDTTFVTRYLPQIPSGIRVRLLTAERQAAALRESLNLYQQQHGTAVELRVMPDRSLHDRHLVVDARDVYQSGASFKDGARNAATSINQIVDVAADLIRAHDANWTAATVVA